MKSAFLVPVAAFAFVLGAPLVARAQSLKVGDPAPALTVGKWVKGPPIKSLADGKVHVVEFWATWCGPCKQSIPHLSELARKFKGKADFVSVSVWENDQARVAPFVKAMGDRMDFTVAMDKVPAGRTGQEGTIAKNWLRAAGASGIPTAFVVDQKGKIVWIGHPTANLGYVVGQVIAGTFDPKIEETFKAKTEAASKEIEAIVALAKAGSTDAALTRYDALIATLKRQSSPKFTFDTDSLATGFAVYALYPALVTQDTKAAHAFARKLYAETPVKDNAKSLCLLAYPLVEPDSTAKDPDLDLAISFAERAVLLTKEKDSIAMEVLATAYAKKGDTPKAIAAQEKLIVLQDADPATDPEAKQHAKDKLAKLKKG